MAARHIVLAAVSFASLFLLASPNLFGEDLPSGGDIDNAKHELLGVINADGVYVRSGPSENSYQTMKLDKGVQVTVVGLKFNWLKIRPPEGSFAYVPKVYIDRRNDGSVGRASREVIAKVGSSLNMMKIAPMAKVNEGDDVTIIGEQDEYFKIKPPEGSVLYVSKNFVDFVKVIAKAGETSDHGAVAQNPGAGTIGGQASPPTGAQPTPDSAVAGSTTKPTADQATALSASTTQPTADAASTQFDQLEARYATASEKPITEQPLEPLLSGYEAVLKQETLPNSMRRVAEVRLATLKLRNEAKQEFLATKSSQDKLKERSKSLVAEQEEIQERIKSNNVELYTVVGTLRGSSLQHAGSTLYRLTDPATGRTVAYLRTPEPKYANLIGQFVGVKGAVSSDSELNMKIIDSPAAVQIIDPTKVNGSIAAEILPPSLLPKAASTGNE